MPTPVSSLKISPSAWSSPRLSCKVSVAPKIRFGAAEWSNGSKRCLWPLNWSSQIERRDRHEWSWKISQNDLPEGEPYTVIEDIPVKIRKDGDLDFIATLEAAEISIGGVNPRDAFQALVYEILDAFDYFTAHQTTLGPEPRRQLSALNRHLVKVHG